VPRESTPTRCVSTLSADAPYTSLALFQRGCFAGGRTAWATHYWHHELSWHLYLGSDFAIGSGSYLVLAKHLPSTSTSAGKVNVGLSDSNVIRIDYVDSTATQRYLYGNTGTQRMTG
jgi:hypothetical protein